MNRIIERLTIWIAWHLPRSLVRWVFCRVMAHATTGVYSATVVGELTGIDVALCRHCDQSPAYEGHTVPRSWLIAHDMAPIIPRT